MEQQIEHLWKILIWAMGVNVSTTLFLAGWMWWIVGQLHQKATFKWIEEQFSKDVKEEITHLNEILKEIRDCLMGDLKNDGVVTRIRRAEQSILILEEKNKV